MTTKYSLENALKFVNELEKIDNLNKISPVYLGQAMKFFAENDDRDNFKKIVDKYLKLIDTSSDEEIRENSYSFLKFICSGFDHGFTNMRYSTATGKNLGLGKIEKLFNELYLIGEGLTK